MSLLLGVHVAKISKVLDNKTTAIDMSNAINRDLDNLGLNSAQIFTHGPRFMVKNKIDYEKVKKTCHDIDLSVHSAYSTVSIWKVNEDNKNEKKSLSYINSVNTQLKSCKQMGAWGLVIHVTKQSPSNVANVMKLLKPLAESNDVKIILEMVSSKADENTYETPAKINHLTKLIGTNENWWCWCVDTAHLWGAGVDIKSYNNMKNWLDEIKYPKKIEMFHLNGSSAIKGSGKDKHEIPFSPDDIIWKNIKPNKSGLKAVIDFASKNHTTVICEINRGSEKIVIKCLDIIKDMVF